MWSDDFMRVPWPAARMIAAKEVWAGAGALVTGRRCHNSLALGSSVDAWGRDE